jgi:hypothetical protein
MANDYVECAITTFDNPYNPFDEFILWDLFDKEKGYYSNQKVARLVHFTDEMTEQEMMQENERAIDLLIALDFTNTFKKFTRNPATKAN